MSSAKLALCFLVLCALSQHCEAARLVPATQQESLAETNRTKAFFCASLCVPCADGKRTVFVSRSKGLFKTVIDLAVTPIAVVAGVVFSPWLYLVAPGYMAAEKAFAGTLGDECPNMEVAYFQDGGVERLDGARLDSLMSKDDYLSRFKQNLDKLYLFDYVMEETGQPPTNWDSVKNRFFPKREQGKLPTILESYLKHADLFCADHGEALGEVMEETPVEGFQSGIPFVGLKPFWDKCQASRGA